MTRRLQLVALALVLTIADAGVYSSLAADAGGGDATVTQLNKKFDQDSVTIKKGQSVTFVNKDPFMHDVFSESPNVGFDLKTQAPGQSSTVKFDNVGEAMVECAIHSSMKMKIIVTE